MRIAVLLAVLFLPSCTAPEHISKGVGVHGPTVSEPEKERVASVVLDLYDSKEPIRLGPINSNRFATMLKTTPVHTRISEMPAAPLGAFTHEGRVYLWHGNAVIHGSGSDERCWSCPLLEYIVTDWAATGYSDQRATVTQALARLETVRGEIVIRTSGPGAFPGGSDALHPIAFP